MRLEDRLRTLFAAVSGLVDHWPVWRRTWQRLSLRAVPRRIAALLRAGGVRVPAGVEEPSATGADRLRCKERPVRHDEHLLVPRMFQACSTGTNCIFILYNQSTSRHTSSRT